ncbi:beta-propeller fold lactonase family protein [candidate division KSB1 bacterium]
MKYAILFRFGLLLAFLLCINPTYNIAQTDQQYGLLKFVEIERGDLTGSVFGLNYASGAAITSDGKFVYVTAKNEDAVGVFSRNSTTGELTFVEAYTDRSMFNGYYNETYKKFIDAGLNGAAHIAISPDDNHVYVTGEYDDAVVVFSRNTTTGKLTLVETHYDGADVDYGLDGPAGIIVSPDNKHVYVAVINSDDIVVYSRNTTTGALIHVETVFNSYSWGLQGIPSSGVNYRGIFFTDANTGWAVGGNGVIINTTDGTEWYQQDSGTGERLDGVYFTDANTGWVVGGGGIILKTTDGGGTWNTQDSQTGYLLRGACFNSSTVGWVVGDGGTILKTTDGGTTWVSQTSNTPEDLYSVHFQDANNGWTVGDNGTILNTSNGGTAWSAQTSGIDDRNLRDIHFISTTAGWAVGDEGVVLKTTNGGTSWSASYPVAGDLKGVQFLDANNGWATGSASRQTVVIKTSDGGSNWTIQSMGTFYDADGSDIHMVDSNNGFLSGEKNSIYKTTNGGAGGSIGLIGAYEIKITNDGEYVYVASRNSNALVVFSRNTTTGQLTIVESHHDGINGLDGLNQPYDLFVCKDHVYVTGFGYNTSYVVVFDRNTGNGTLTYNTTYEEDVGGVSGISGAWGMAINPEDSSKVYVSGSHDYAITVFSRNKSTGELSYYKSFINEESSIVGLRRVNDVIFSPNGDHVYVTAFLDHSIVGFARNSTTGDLTFIGAKRYYNNGMHGAFKLELSSDGRFVYLASNYDAAVSVFYRNPETGELTFLESHKNLADGYSGLHDTYDLTISPDEKNVYVTGRDNNGSIVIFNRNTQNGLLTYVSTIKNNENGITGLRTTHTGNFTPDGKYFYVAGYGSDAIVVFERDLSTGGLTLVEELYNGQNGVTGLDDPGPNLISSDGRFLYQACLRGDAVVVFSINEYTGKLTYKQTIFDNTDDVDGLDMVTDLSFDPDERFIYAGSQGDNAVVLFDRDSETGLLTFIESYFDETNGITGLAGARGIKVSPDGGIVIVGGRNDNAVNVFNRDRVTGKLNYVEMHQEGVDGVEGLLQVRDIELSPDSKFAYVAGQNSAAIAVFQVNRLFSHVGNKNIGEGGKLEFDLSSPLSAYRTLTFYADLSGLPASANASFNENSGKFSWDPSFLEAGTYTITFYVTDGVITLSETITITVSDVNLTSGGKTFQQKSQTITAAEGGTVSIESGGIYTMHAVDIPANAIPGDKTVVVRPPDPANLPTAVFEQTPSAVEFLIDGEEGGYTFQDSVEITLEFKDFEVKANKNNMRVHLWDAAKSIWKKVRGNHYIDPTDNTIKVNVKHFSIYGVIEVVDTTSTNEVSPGWNMICAPVSPEDVTDPELCFGDDIYPFRFEDGNSNVYEYDEAAGDWILPTAITEGNGYILYSFWDTDVDLAGLQATSDFNHILTYTNANGWHLIGNPYAVNIDFDTDITLGAGVDAIFYRWENGQYNFYPGGGLTSTIDPWDGFFVHTNTDGAEVDIFYPGISKRASRSIPDIDWRVQITAESGDVSDIHNYLGTGKNAEDTFDYTDAYELVPLNDEFISAFFPHEDWKDNPANYTQDIRKIGEEPVSWNFNVMTNSSDETVKLKWDVPGGIDPELDIVLTTSSGEQIDMRSEKEYSYKILANLKKEENKALRVNNNPADFSGLYKASDVTTEKFTITAGRDLIEEDPLIPDVFFLKQNYPNPFNPETIIEFGIPESGNVVLKIYNTLGQEVRTLVNKEHEAGVFKMRWDGTNNLGKRVASGVYIYRLSANNKTEIKKMLLIR